MRAFIKRTEECKDYLAKVKIDKKNKFDQDYWLNTSQESFHGEIKNDNFVFMDARLPNFKLPIQFIKIES